MRAALAAPFVLLLSLEVSAADGDIIELLPGRLFHTQEEREQLERPSPPQAEEAPAQHSLRLDGIVVRSLGPTTIWINGHLHTPDTDGLSVHPEPSATAARIVTPDRQEIRLQVGETMTLEGAGQ